jgi:hypothetical protein
MNAATMNDIEKIYNDLDDEHVKARIIYAGDVAIDGFEDPITGLFVDAECTKPVDMNLLKALVLARTFIRHPNGYLFPLMTTRIEDGVTIAVIPNGDAYAYDFENDHWAHPGLY